MAVIEKRGPMQWRVKVRREGVTTTRTFIREVDAQTWARETEVAIQRGSFKDMRPAQTAFEDFARRYLAEVTPTKKSGDREAHRIATLLEAPEFKRPIGAIQATHVATYRDRRLQSPVHPTRAAQAAAAEPAKGTKGRAAAVRLLAPQTVLHELNTFSGIWEHVRKEWSIPLGENPVRGIRLPQRGKARTRRLASLELEYLQRATAGVHGLPQAMTLALETSMRLGELLGLTWRHVDLTAGVAHLPATKNGHARDVALSTAALAALRDLRPLQEATSSNAHGPALSAALALAHKEGRVFHWAASDSFDKTWRRALVRARAAYQADQAAKVASLDPDFLQDLRWHDLRHEAISRLFERNLNAFEVASMSGHRSMQMLARYTHMQAKLVAAKLG